MHDRDFVPCFQQLRNKLAANEEGAADGALVP
jgi:hypothetical protein